MRKASKAAFFSELESRCGRLRALSESRSLFETQGGEVRIYVRYSKVHGRGQGFFGLRKADIDRIADRPSVVCFILEGLEQPLIVPYSTLADALSTAVLAPDGQFKAAIFIRDQSFELYLNGSGRSNVTAHYGWDSLESVTANRLAPVPELEHCQIQSMLGQIGNRAGFDVWIPASDRARCITFGAVELRQSASVAECYRRIGDVFDEIDVIWLPKGSGEPHSLFEIEHSTPIYSGLLRFNDVHLVAPMLKPNFSIVATESRRQLFHRLLRRPTFQASGLFDLCTFLEYSNLSRWHQRITSS
jgi:hypothetical protein